MSFPLSKEILPPPKQETFFFGVAERSEAVAERYERTIQFQATTRAGRAISHLFGKKFAQMLELVHKMKLRQKSAKNPRAPKARDMAKEWNPSFGLGRNPRAGKMRLK